jgi:hypothetical protein
MKARKYLTLDEAQKLVPEVRKRILKVMRLNQAIEMLSEIEIAYYDEVESAFSEIKFNKKFHSLCLRLFSELESLMEMGAVLDDIEKGTVNFYSISKGKPLVLCWNLGDKHIRYWREIDEDLSERKPLSKLR